MHINLSTSVYEHLKIHMFLDNSKRMLKSWDSFDHKPDLIPDSSNILDDVQIRKPPDGVSKEQCGESTAPMHSLAQFNRLSSIPLQV